MDEPPTTVISFLGHPATISGGYYRQASYRFPDSEEVRPSRVFVGALLDELVHRGQPADKLVICGTSTSAWHALGLDILDEEAEASRSILEAIKEAAATAEGVTSDHLPKLAKPIADRLGCEVELVVIGYCDTREKQLAVVKRLADAVPGPARLVLDVTHGFRHLPLIAIAAAGFLEHARDCHLEAVYYGMNEARRKDETTGQEISPVVDLKGMLRILDVSEALGTFKLSGRLTPIAAQLREESPELMRAAFRIDLHRLTDRAASRAANSAAEKIASSPDALLNVAEAEISEALRVASEPRIPPFVRQLAQGKRALEVRDYSSAITLLWESLISFGVSLCMSYCKTHGKPPKNPYLNSAYRADAQTFLRCLIVDDSLELTEFKLIDVESITSKTLNRLAVPLRQPHEQCAADRHYHQLRQLRNAAAHGSRPKSAWVRSAFGSPDEMDRRLKVKVSWLESLYPGEIERGMRSRKSSDRQQPEVAT